MAGELEQPVYTLKNVVVVLQTGAKALINIHVKRNPIYAPKKPGNAIVGKQVWMGEDFPNIEAEVYNDDQYNSKNIIPNAAIEAFEINSTADAGVTVLPADFWERFPPDEMVFGGMDTTWDGEKPGTIKFPIMSNVINPGVNGGYTLGTDGITTGAGSGGG